MQIVAPAGSYSALKSAVKSGADAVYLGMPLFGARAKAENFSEETLRSTIEYAHLFGTKVFITLNTLIKDDEIEKAVDMAKFAYSCNADAAIVQDIRYIGRLKKELPDFPLHASTQMGVHNALGAQVLLDLGITRAVLARETLPEDIREIKKTGIEIEFFVQGALCVCFSGNCYFSSLASSYSGNRGKCMQLCRKPYILNGKRGYHLSAKDICLYGKLDELQRLGVDAIKIEGRMRSDEYVAQAVRVYKSSMAINSAERALKAVFNRGDYCTAYMEENAAFNVIYDKAQGNIGIKVGNIAKVNGHKLFVPGFSPHKNDGYKIMRNGEEICGGSVSDGCIIVNGSCKVGDEVRRTYDGALSDELHSIERKISVDVRIYAEENKPLIAVLTANDTIVSVESADIAQTAISKSLTDDDFFRAFSKTSDYPFDPKITVSSKGEIFLPVSSLNEFRRTCYSQLKTALLSHFPQNRYSNPYFGLNYTEFTGKGDILMIESDKQITNRVLYQIEYLAINPRNYADFSVPKVDVPVLLNLPSVIRGADMDIISRAVNRKDIFGVISNNLYSLRLTDKPILLGPGHNIIGSFDKAHVRSFETDSLGGKKSWVYAFGYAPLMTLCHCPYKSCIDCKGNERLIDGNGREFKLRRYKLAHCYRQLLNCVPLYLPNVNKPAYNKFYDCTELSATEIEKLFDGSLRVEAYTRGNINRGLK